MELIIRVGHYAGWPTMAHARIQYKEVLNEDASKKK
jgi:alkylhydroperoxidase/carboxymuconolactone decarboxylase family protein YurZ